MKVYVRYDSDGEFVLTVMNKDATGVNIFEMPDDKWEAYQTHMRNCREWHQYIGEMSGRFECPIAK